MKRCAKLSLWWTTLLVVFTASVSVGQQTKAEDDFFTAGGAARMQIEIPAEGMAVLREYIQVWGRPRPERIDVRATIREGGRVFTNVAIHLKGSFSFQPIDRKPSLTLNFDKFAPGQSFHGLTKLHLNNSVQDGSYLCEQLAHELFAEAGVPSPRVGHALAQLNGRDLGLYVVLEGENKQFVKRNFKSAKGNLYDGGSGGDVTKALKVDSGENPDDRSDLTNLVKAAREPDPAKRLARLEQVLDVERFVSFAATEAFIVHWDGYAYGCNNYRLFHDTARDKMVFMPHGLDQLFGTSSSTALSITPVFKGMIAKQLFAVPEGRRRYLDRLAQLSTNEFRVEAIHARVDKLAAQLRPAFQDSPARLAAFNGEVSDLKTRITQRAASVVQQLKTPRQPAGFPQEIAQNLVRAETTMRQFTWNFKAGTTPATAGRTVQGPRQILQVTGRSPSSSGAWRSTVLLDAGHYEFSGEAHTEGLTAADLKGTNGVILRISGERSAKGLAISDEWKPLRYEFDVRGIEDVELICEFRGASGFGFFDAGTLRLVRKGPPLNKGEEE